MPREDRRLVGTPTEVARTIERYRDGGAEGVMVSVPRNDAETIERFADEVIPEFA